MINVRCLVVRAVHTELDAGSSGPGPPVRRGRSAPGRSRRRCSRLRWRMRSRSGWGARSGLRMGTATTLFITPACGNQGVSHLTAGGSQDQHFRPAETLSGRLPGKRRGTERREMKSVERVQEVPIDVEKDFFIMCYRTSKPIPLSVLRVSSSSRWKASSWRSGVQSVMSSASRCAAIEGLNCFERRPVSPLALLSA